MEGLIVPGAAKGHVAVHEGRQQRHPRDVALTAGSRPEVLTVPVAALAGGGYGVQVVDGGWRRPPPRRATRPCRRRRRPGWKPAGLAWGVVVDKFRPDRFRGPMPGWSSWSDFRG